MTIEQLLDLPPEGLEAIPDAELETMLAPYFKFTRPASPIGPVVKGSVMTPGNTPSRSYSKPAGSGPLKSNVNAMLELLMKGDDVSVERVNAMKQLIKR